MISVPTWEAAVFHPGDDRLAVLVRQTEVFHRYLLGMLGYIPSSTHTDIYTDEIPQTQLSSVISSGSRRVSISSALAPHVVTVNFWADRFFPDGSLEEQRAVVISVDRPGLFPDGERFPSKVSVYTEKSQPTRQGWQERTFFRTDYGRLRPGSHPTGVTILRTGGPPQFSENWEIRRRNLQVNGAYVRRESVERGLLEVAKRYPGRAHLSRATHEVRVLGARLRLPPLVGRFRPETVFDDVVTFVASWAEGSSVCLRGQAPLTVPRGLGFVKNPAAVAPVACCL